MQNDKKTANSLATVLSEKKFVLNGRNVQSDRKTHSLLFKTTTDRESALLIAKELGFEDAKSTGKKSISLPNPAIKPKKGKEAATKKAPQKKVKSIRKKRTQSSYMRISIDAQVKQVMSCPDSKVLYRVVEQISREMGKERMYSMMRKVYGNGLMPKVKKGSADLSGVSTNALQKELAKRWNSKRK